MLQWFRSQLPNILTLGNLFSGCLGIIFVLNGQLKIAAYLILLGGAFDFLDGFIARLLKVSSPLGAQLDSLSDMVTFGVLPGMMLYKFMLINNGGEAPYLFFQFIPMLFPICAAIRLARFNISTEQSDKFIGLATPAATLFVAGLPFISETSLLSFLHQSNGVLILISLALAFLMISSLELFAFKFKNTSLEENKVKYLFLALSLILLIVLGLGALPIIIILYILASVLELNLLKKKTKE